MLGHSHSLSGAATGAAAGMFVLHLPLTGTAALAGLTAGMALLPDLDSVGSCSARSLGLLSEAVAWVIRLVSGGHRHGSHSLVGIAAFTGLAWLACAFRSDIAGKAGLALLITLAVSSGLEALHLTNGHTADALGIAAAAAVVWAGWGLALVPLAVALGCAAHLAGDALTDSGIPLLWPLSMYRFKAWPEPFSFTTGTRPETLIVDPLLSVAFLALASWAVVPHADHAVWAYALHRLHAL
jgi:membrane-bound metal-dependent hydrolase YbcI (DUF457 family)